MNRLTIYFTSDTHGYLFPTNFIDSTIQPMGLLSMRFPKDGNTLVIDGGDAIQGSPLTYYCHEEGLPAPVAPVMNRMGYDYVTLGNHDFNYGPEWLASHLNALHAPCLCANVEDSQGRLAVRPWAVHTLENGLKVGLFGVVTDWVNRWERPENLKGITVSDPLPAARKAVAALQEQKVDLIVCISHSGLEKDPDTGSVLSETGEHVTCLLCEQLPIDLMLAGHQHVPMANKTWAGTHVVQTSCNATDYVRVTLSEEGVFHSELCPVTPAETISAGEDALWAGLQRFLARPVGRLARPLRPAAHLRMAYEGSDIANFFNQVMLWASGADLSCTALANQVKGLEEVVTVQDVIATYPYSNTLVVVSVDGKTLRLALEQCAKYFEQDETSVLRVSDEYLKPKQAHYNYDYYTGLTYAFDVSRPAGSRVTKLERNGQPIVDDDTFTLCMNNYRATGAGNYDYFAALPHVREIQTEMSELILNYLREHTEVRLPEKRAYAVTGGRLPEEESSDRATV